MRRAAANLRRAALAVAVLGLVIGGCGEEDNTKQSSARGAPKKSGKKGSSQAGASQSSRGDGGEDSPEIEDDPNEKPIELHEKSFSRRRDPFRNFVVTERPEPEPDAPRAARKVKLAQYAFEDLRLIIIANSGRGIKPRAQFVGSDGRSGTVMQGEYFSSAELLLAAVNRDYVEVEVVDEELAGNLGLKRGERRPIFLRND